MSSILSTSIPQPTHILNPSPIIRCHTSSQLGHRDGMSYTLTSSIHHKPVVTAADELDIHLHHTCQS